jgi:outer membrane protein TolC
MNYVDIKTAKVDIRRALAILELCPDLELDEQLKLSTLEGETELTEIVSLLLAENEDDEGNIGQVKSQIQARQERIARFERRIEARKNAIISLMDTANTTKLPLPEATVSLRTLRSRPKVFDPELLPDGFYSIVTTRKPDIEAIQAAFERRQPIPGVTITNGGSSLSVRRK